MDETLARDIIRRALASLRERNALPSVDLPPVILTPLEGGRGYLTRVALDLAQAAEAADIPNVSVDALARTLGSYLAEVVDLVPAYGAISHVEVASDGVIRLYAQAQ